MLRSQPTSQSGSDMKGFQLPNLLSTPGRVACCRNSVPHTDAKHLHHMFAFGSRCLVLMSFKGPFQPKPFDDWVILCYNKCGDVVLKFTWTEICIGVSDRNFPMVFQWLSAFNVPATCGREALAGY